MAPGQARSSRSVVVVDSVLVLEQRLDAVGAAPARLQLPLTADQRLVLRGRRRTRCGREVLLQLPRVGVLSPGDHLADASRSIVVEVTAASEDLMRVRASSPLALLQAAYHLGNRHVALELHEDGLLLPRDSVLESMLRGRGLDVTYCAQPFNPEGGAYQKHHHP